MILLHALLVFAMHVLKHQKEAAELIEREGDRRVSLETAHFLNAAAKLELEFEENTGGVSINKSMERRLQKEKVEGAIAGMRRLGASDESIVAAIMDMYQVSRDYVLALMESQVA